MTILDTSQADPDTTVTTEELIQLAAVDNQFYEKTFFPDTVRQQSPPFHLKMDEALASDARFISFKMYRDSGKTTKVRLFISKRIAYYISRTILIVSNSQGHAEKTLDWLKKKVEFNKTWAQTYQLSKGIPWTANEISILHGVEKKEIRIIAVGITGQVRGFNIDDWRPDLILVDDGDDEETTGTAEQIDKYKALFFGALAKSLSPRSESPLAKMIQLQTPLAEGDTVDVASKDPQWLSLAFSCFDEKGESSWPQRLTTKELQDDKSAHIRRGQYALWMREMEVTLVPEGGSSFVPENLRYYDVLPDKMIFIITIDPASADSKTADDQVAMVLGFWKTRIYVIEYTAVKGEEQEELIVTLMQYVFRYPVLGIYAEAIGYQRTLAKAIENEMRRLKRWIPVHQVQDMRNKANRITHEIGKASGYGNLYVRTTHSKLILQYSRYSPRSKDHDDVLDALAMGLTVGLDLQVADWLEGEYTIIDDHKSTASKQLEFRQCP